MPPSPPPSSSNEAILILGAVDLPALADDNDDDEAEEEHNENEGDEFEREGDEDKFDGKVEQLNVSEDLGSLEPSVLDDVTGRDSLLDGEDATVERSKTKERRSARSTISISDAMYKVLYAPAAAISKANERRQPRHLKKYTLMDDNDIEKSFPISPPLEILAFNVSKESDVGLNPVAPPTKREQEVFDNWIKDNRASRIARSFSNGTEPEPNLNFSSDEAGSAWSSDSDDSGADKEDSPAPNADEIAAVNKSRSSKRRKRRGRRSRRNDTSRSIASGSSSLLSMPIEEETAEDLQESEASEAETAEGFNPYNSNLKAKPLVRVRSAPNLAGFAKHNGESNTIADSLKMTGVNSYHTAEIFRGVDSSRSSRSSKKQMSSKSGKSDPLANRLPPGQTKPKKKPLFRQERALRAAIHRSPSYISDPSSSEDSVSLSSRSKRARNARIQRLHGLAHPFFKSPQQSDDETPPKKTNFLSRRKIAQLQQSTKPESPNRTPTRNNAARSTGTASSTNDDDSDPPQPQTPTRSGSNTPARSVKSSGTVSSCDSGFSGGGSYVIDMLDVQLAELQRPDGELKGPDEGSL